MADRGFLDLDTPVCNYVPEMKMWDTEASEKMSLRDMLCHRTGLGGYDVIWPNEEGRGRATMAALKEIPTYYLSNYSTSQIGKVLGVIAQDVPAIRMKHTKRGNEWFIPPTIEKVNQYGIGR